MRICLQMAAAAALACALAGPAAAAGHDGPQSPLDGLTGQTLSAIDGSTITIEPDEDGMTRVLTAPNGSVQKAHFAYLDSRLGTVSDGHDPSKLAGVFRQTPNGIEAEFADGHDETLQASGGGLAMTIADADGSRACMAWFPKGHVFSESERRAALAEYAKRLGVALPGGGRAAAATDCAPAAEAKPDKAQAADAAATTEAQSETVPSLAEAAHAARATEASAKVVKSSAASSELEKPILVHTSQVHPIDPPPGAAIEAGAGGTVAANAPGGGPAASTCLSVASDGHHWGFRNGCAYPVQFVYCMKEGGDPLTACANGSVPGSVEANSFAALTADKTLSEQDAEHDFRWVGCRGGAGEVVPRLDRTSPPSGRCIRAQAS